MQKVFWIFGYGSLMWDPGFHPAETVKARLAGYARTFCMRSTRYRGTTETPGLVLGLDVDQGAECSGLALRVAEEDHDHVMLYLRERELVTGAYQEQLVTVALEDGRRIEAIAYVMRRDHEQYVGNLCHREQAEIIARATGGRGPNAEYLFNTARHLAEIGLADPWLEELSADVRRLLDQTRRPDGPR
ncbi:gamma-glutamylcyclotransferase [Paracoccus spongiarum]|uniref:glutathione-specific gamma-glutamylcyclotransferase n=1 Tax=Paracoccus spongiarum TaxID=3064387 RepID=A0ABT9JDX0_9RHOB|nr:gamma-glutamylcyclotransferase [Paracoccus sp. 2205BS29-5]MDP5307815.1 gamma-glutamylcyclotransferase [Paracoccus sp. 2205BS29-5]